MSNGGEFTPSEEIGRQLRRFFLELLEETNLRDYRSTRMDYIGGRVDENPETREPPHPGATRYLSPEAAALLDSDALKQIEAHIGMVTGSGGSSVICVVYPPD
jgi:hypothetical protein